MSKPKFADLTPEQVNDLIATKVMGWHKENDYDRHCYWLDSDGNQVARRDCDYDYSPTEGDWDSGEDISFYGSLDACWKAEEKLNVAAEGELARMMSYGFQGSIETTAMYNSYVLILLDILKKDPMVNFDIAVSIVHATASQKCEAILRVIGEVG